MALLCCVVYDVEFVFLVSLQGFTGPVLYFVKTKSLCNHKLPHTHTKTPYNSSLYVTTKDERKRITLLLFPHQREKLN